MSDEKMRRFVERMEAAMVRIHAAFGHGETSPEDVAAEAEDLADILDTASPSEIAHSCAWQAALAFIVAEQAGGLDR